MTAIGITAKAAANGRLVAKLSSTKFPITLESVTPTRTGEMKSPRVRANVKIEPATSPGSDSGRITERNVRQLRAPRSAEASRYDSGIRSSAAYTGSTMNGSQTYEKTIHTAGFVYRRF